VGLQLATVEGLSYKHGTALGVSPMPITAELWRQVNVGEAIAAERKAAARAMAAFLGHDAASLLRRTPRVRDRVRGELEQVAEVYTAAWSRGEPPVKAVQKALGNVSYGSARGLVYRAREAGLLPATKRGRANAAQPPVTKSRLGRKS
jgi:hypothetical protein